MPEGEEELKNSTMTQKQPCLHKKKGQKVVCCIFVETDILKRRKIEVDEK